MARSPCGIAWPCWPRLDLPHPSYTEEQIVKTMEDLFYALLEDVYYAEKQLLKTLPKLAKKANNEQLEKAFLEHREQTEGHIERLEKTFEMIGKKAKGKKCDAILGII